MEAELHRLAHRYMSRERGDHTLQTAALVNEAYLKLVDQRVTWRNRAHFFAIVAQNWWKTDPQEFLKGKEFFERALEVDPNYALSYCGLSSYWGFGSAFGMIPPEVGWPKTVAATSRALNLDDSLPEAHTNQGGVDMVYRRDFAAAEKAIKRSLELNPKFQEAHFIYSNLLLIRTRFDEAIAEARQAVELILFRHDYSII